MTEEQTNGDSLVGMAAKKTKAKAKAKVVAKKTKTKAKVVAKKTKKPAGAGAIVQEVRFAARPSRVFDAYLDAKSHAAFTGAPARIDATPGVAFSVWDGYITGTNLEIERPGRIVQAWRTTEFPDEHADSRLELLLTPDGTGTLLRLVQTGLPVDQVASYEQGWHDHYWSPMREFLG